MVVFFWVTSGARTHDTRNHNPMLCQLSYSHRIAFFPKASAKVLLFFDMTKFFCKKKQNYSFCFHFLLFSSIYLAFYTQSSSFKHFTHIIQCMLTRAGIIIHLWV